jgi:hypothetical protein
MVIPPAKTGKEITNKKEVTNIEILNKDNKIKLTKKDFINKIVTIKLIDLAIEDTPAICKEKIIISILILLK